MRTRSMLRAIVAVTALAAAAAPAAADPIEFTLATPALCAPPTIASACVPDVVVGTSTTSPPTGPYVHNGGCTQVGSYTDKFVQVYASYASSANGGVAVTGGFTDCVVYVGGIQTATVRADGGHPTASRQFLVNGYSLLVCTRVYTQWADRHVEDMQSADPACTPIET